MQQKTRVASECESRQIEPTEMSDPRYPKLAPPIFIVGNMHSGTTLLRNIFRQHPAVFMIRRESSYFSSFDLIRRSFANLHDDRVLLQFINFVVAVIYSGFKINSTVATKTQPPDISAEGLNAMLASAKRCREHGEIFQIVADYLTLLTGKARWVEKTPSHVFHIERILSAIPQAQFIEVVRDPRDILASKKTRRLSVWTTERYKPEERAVKHLELAYDPVWDSLSWKSAIRAGQGARKKLSKRIHTIRYEDLVAEPELRLREICDFLNLEFASEMLSISLRNSAEKVPGRPRPTGITPDSVGRWRKVLAPAEVALCQSLLKTELDQFGYACAPISARQRAKIPVLLLGSALEFIQRLFRRWRLGDRHYFLSVLSTYWKRLLRLAYP